MGICDRHKVEEPTVKYRSQFGNVCNKAHEEMLAERGKPHFSAGQKAPDAPAKPAVEERPEETDEQRHDRILSMGTGDTAERQAKAPNPQPGDFVYTGPKRRVKQEPFVGPEKRAVAHVYPVQHPASDTAQN